MRWWLVLVSSVACRVPEAPPNLRADYDHDAAWAVVEARGVPAGGDVVVVVLDDVGVEKLSAYGVHDQPVRTPVIDALAEEGVVFANAWSEPTCSPTRAAALTGRNPSQTGIGRWIHSEVNPIRLAQEEITLAERLADAPTPYTSAVAGKWHLTEWSDGLDPSRDALDQGFARHRGAMANVQMTFALDGEGTYTWWEKNVDGAIDYTETYATTDTVDEAIAFFAEVDGPRFLWLAFNAPHSPLHRPPAGLLAEPLPEEPTDAERYAAMLEAVDTELGRFLASLDADTRAAATLIVLGDNGTYAEAMTLPSDAERAKDTVYDGGVHVPLIVAGPYVDEPGVSAALVQTTDLFATVAHVAGLDVRGDAGLDSASFLPQVVDPDHPGARAYAFAEEFYDGDAAWTVRDAGYKLIRRNEPEREELFRYAEGAFDEGANLLAGELTEADRTALDELREAWRAQRSWMDAHEAP